MKKPLFLLAAGLLAGQPSLAHGPLLAAATATRPAAAPTFTGLKRTFSDNSEWQLATSAGAGKLKRVVSDGSQWQLALPGHQYTIRRTLSDNAAWSISEAGHTLRFKTTYGQDPNEWDFGQWNFKTAFKNDFKQWGAYGFELRSQFSDFSSWTIDDKGRVPDLAMKGAMVFVAVLVATGH